MTKVKSIISERYILKVKNIYYTQHYNLQALKHLIEYNELTEDEVLSFVTHVNVVFNHLI
jgi:hypothetical protein